MQLWYNDQPLHVYGDILRQAENRRATPLENPAQYEVTLTIKIVAFTDAANYHENRLKVDGIRSVLSTPTAILKWVNDDVGENAATYLNRTVTVVSNDLPEEGDGGGSWRQECVITFSWTESITEASDNLQLTFLRTGSASMQTLTTVTTFKEGMRVTRFSPFHSERSQSLGEVSIAGTYTADSTKTLANRRIELNTLRDTWMRELNGKDGTLKYGTAFNGSSGRVVKIDDFTCDIDQERDCIKWALTASFVRFPNEAMQCVAEFSTSVNEDLETGENVLSLTGKVAAATEALAIAKLTLLRTTTLAAESFSSAMPTRKQTEKRKVSVSPSTGEILSTATTIDDTVNADNAASGITFIELSFNEEYRKQASEILSWDVRCSDSEDIKAGLLTTTYSGWVSASATEGHTAYQAAKDKADALGKLAGGESIATPYQFLTNAQYTAEYRRHEKPAPACAMEFVRLEFQFSYQRKSDNRIYYEVQSQKNTDNEGETVENVSGFIVAVDKATAEGVLANHIKKQTDWASKRMRNETVSWGAVGISELAGIVPETGGKEVELTSGESKYVQQFGKLDFSFQIIYPASTRTITTCRYEMEVSKDLVASQKQTRISGLIIAPSKTAAEDWLGTSPSAGYLKTWQDTYGSCTAYSLGEAHEVLPTVEGGAAADILLSSFPFTATFIDKLTDDSAILECTLTEEIQHTGTRWIEQPTAAGISVIQNCGIECGTRTLSGSCKATTEAYARAWLRRVIGSNANPPVYPFPATAPVSRYVKPPRITIEPIWLPRYFQTADTDAIGRNEEAQCVSLNFSLQELLPLYSLAL